MLIQAQANVMKLALLKNRVLHNRQASSVDEARRSSLDCNQKRIRGKNDGAFGLQFLGLRLDKNEVIQISQR